jgi:hypothetical protein
MITGMEKRDLEVLTDGEVKEVLEFAGELAQRVRGMTEIVRDMNYRTERFIQDFYAQGNSGGHQATYS